MPQQTSPEPAVPSPACLAKPCRAASRDAMHGHTLPSDYEPCLPRRAVHCLTPTGTTGTNQTPPSLPCHAFHQQHRDCPCCATPASICHAQPRSGVPDRTAPCLHRQVSPDQTRPRRALLCDAGPRRACLANHRVTLRCHTEPSHACVAVPRSAGPRRAAPDNAEQNHASTGLPCRARTGHSRTGTCSSRLA